MVPTRPQRRRPRALSAVITGALVAGLVHAGPLPAAAEEPPDPDVHYDFDAADPGSDAITDVSGNDRHATLVHGETASLVDGADGGTALGLPGGSPDSNAAHVRLPLEVLDDAEDLTVSTRIRWNGGTTPWQWVYALGTDTSRYLFSTPYDSDGHLRTAITQGGAGGEDQTIGSAALPAEEWVTLTVSLDSDAGEVTTYLDGAPVDSAATSMTAAELLDGSTDHAGYIGNSFYPDPLFAGAVDDFRIYHSALSQEQIVELLPGEAPEPTGLLDDSFDVVTPLDTAPDLPATAPATFSDGYDRPLAIEWEDVDPDDYAEIGTFTASGTAGEWPVTATVTVIREGQLTIDLAGDTGEFHGGASGALYGLYGPGVPSDNLVDGMGVRTVATKGQDGAQHPGSDALEVLPTLADTTDGDIYVRTTDYYRGFPYQWPGDTPEEKLSGYMEVMEQQLDQIASLDPAYLDNLVIEPFNEPEGNMFGTGEWSYNGVSWLDDPTDYFQAWDDAHALIREKLGDVRISGPNTSILYTQVQGFMEHAVEAGTVPDVITWHELSHPAQIRDSVATYRGWEQEIFSGTEYEGTELPININEYAFNYHTSVPGQMIQWISAIEESKVDAMLAFWNINGNLADSTVESNRANGQWWLYHSYSRMTGHTVDVHPPHPGENYTLQGVATLDEDKAQAKALFGGADGPAWVEFDNVPEDVFGGGVHAWVREIPWTGQLGDSGPPELLSEEVIEVNDGSVVFDFGGAWPELKESSAYEIVLTPAGDGTPDGQPPTLWEGSFEAEDADHSGDDYSLNGPEGSPSNVSGYHTSGGYHVGGLRTGSDVELDFTVEVPEDGTYDLRVFANSHYLDDLVQDHGPTNVFMRVNGENEQELFLPLGHSWVVWDHTETTVDLQAGENVITLAAQSLDGSGATQGDALVDRITLALPNPEAATAVYQAELAELHGATPVYHDWHVQRSGASGSGGVELDEGDSATFWVYAAEDGEAVIDVHSLGTGQVDLVVNGQDLGRVPPSSMSVAAWLSGGINKVTLTGAQNTAVIDRIGVTPDEGHLDPAVHQAEDAVLGGETEVAELRHASSGSAVTGIGGEPDNANTLTFEVEAESAGTHALSIRYANPETSPPSHYNPNPMVRQAELSINGAESESVLFAPTYHENNFAELTVPVELEEGVNTLEFSAEEPMNFDGETRASETWPDILLRSQYGPVIDRITVASPGGDRLGRP
jgi:hypothetical protein